MSRPPARERDRPARTPDTPSTRPMTPYSTMKARNLNPWERDAFDDHIKPEPWGGVSTRKR